MGLAASQARLLSITLRITDDEYQLMKLSSQQLALRVKGEDLADEYDYKLNAAAYTYNYGEGNTAVNFNYSDVMGSGAIDKGLTSPIILSDAQSGKIVLNGTYGMAAKKAGLNENGNAGSPTAEQFNAFMAIVTSDSETDWNAARTGNTTANSSNNSENKFTIVTKKELTDEAKALRKQYDDARSYVFKTYGSQPTKEWVEGNNDFRVVDDLRVDDSIKNTKFAIDKEVQKQVELKTIGGGYYKDVPNEKGYTLAKWNEAVNKYCSSKGLKPAYVINGGYPSAANATKTTTPTTPTENTSTSTTNVDKDKQAKAKFYYQVFEQIFSKGYAVDDQITNRSYMDAQLANNKYKIDGKLASEHTQVSQSKLKVTTAEKVEAEKEKIKSWYNKEEKKISNQEKSIDTKMTSLNAEISALNTEKESVNSLIQKNIERSFTYCQKG